jgi:DNA replication and repair protein RecF
MSTENRITDIRLQHFRSYGDASFEIDSGVTIIVGPNASGKTNLLEAILIVARGSSYKAKDAELVEFGSSWARLDAHTPLQTRTVKIKTEPTASKEFVIDDQAVRRLHQTKTLPTVLFEPNNLLLLSGSPELRRGFLDDLIEQSQAGYGSIRRHYKRVLAQRNALLKKNSRDLREQLFVWNLRLSELGGRIARERHLLTARFAEQMNDLYGSLSGSTNDIGLKYITQFSLETYETALLHKLEESIDLDVLRGFTAAGPHRDDLRVFVDGHEAPEVASRGETRTLVLALKIMELQLLETLCGTRPLLLMDDVFSELDGRRRQALTRFVSDYQTFITTTDADVVMQHFTSSTIIPLAK